MLGLLKLPIELLRLAFHALQGLVDALRARNRLRFESTVLINAPREAVWRFNTADHMVLDGPPVMEISREPVSDSADLWLTRFAVGGQPSLRGGRRRMLRPRVEKALFGPRLQDELGSYDADSARPQSRNGAAAC